VEERATAHRCAFGGRQIAGNGCSRMIERKGERDVCDKFVISFLSMDKRKKFTLVRLLR